MVVSPKDTISLSGLRNVILATWKFSSMSDKQDKPSQVITTKSLSKSLASEEKFINLVMDRK